MKTKDLIKALQRLPPDGTTGIPTERGLIRARQTKYEVYIRNNFTPCKECVFGLGIPAADNCPYRTACFANTRPDGKSIIFVNHITRNQL